MALVPEGSSQLTPTRRKRRVFWETQDSGQANSPKSQADPVRTNRRMQFGANVQRQEFLVQLLPTNFAAARNLSAARLLQQLRAFVKGFPEEFAEDGVGPGKPRAGELLRVVLVEGFVDEAGAGVRAAEYVEALVDFFVACGGESLNDHA